MEMEYPKMLYTGDQEQYSGRIVHDEDEETQLRKAGLVDYADLPEPEPKIEEVEPGEIPQGFVTTEQFDAVAERLAVAEAEIKRLHEVVAQPSAIQAGDVIQPQSVDYSTLTSDQLRALLDEKGIAYLARDNKETLINLLTQPVPQE